MTDRRYILALAALLVVTVATQIFYVTVVSGSENETLRPLTWFTELFAFAGIAIIAHTLAARRPGQGLAWSTIAFAGVLNTFQVGIGLSMFGPAMEAGDTTPQLFAAVLAGAFFFYFLAKLLLGVAAIVLGLPALRSAGMFGKAAGGVALLAGVAAIGLSLLAMIDAKTWTFSAGAAGTVVTAVLAIIIARLPASEG